MLKCNALLGTIYFPVFFPVAEKKIRSKCQSYTIPITNTTKEKGKEQKKLRVRITAQKKKSQENIWDKKEDGPQSSEVGQTLTAATLKKVRQ